MITSIFIIFHKAHFRVLASNFSSEELPRGSCRAFATSHPIRSRDVMKHCSCTGHDRCIRQLSKSCKKLYCPHIVPFPHRFFRVSYLFIQVTHSTTDHGIVFGCPEFWSPPPGAGRRKALLQLPGVLSTWSTRSFV